MNPDQYAQGILAGDRIMLARAITLMESTLPEDQTTARLLLKKVESKTGNALRIGITGAPGVGKSTFIEAFGNLITSKKNKVAILTIDPSSLLTRGSILGDKTRMAELSKNPNAFIRPTSSSSFLGGVAGHTREAMLLCEAAGFNIILIETVGVGQSEVMVRNMVDFFLLLMLAGAGDELQGIKKGVMEMADAVVVTKADGDNAPHATKAQAEYQHALHLLPASSSGWIPKVLTCSAIKGTGIDEIWKMIQSYQKKTSESGYFDENRTRQNITWFQDHFHQLLNQDYLKFPGLKKVIDSANRDIREGKTTPHQAAEMLLDAYHEAIKQADPTSS